MLDIKPKERKEKTVMHFKGVEVDNAVFFKAKAKELGYTMTGLLNEVIKQFSLNDGLKIQTKRKK